MAKNGDNVVPENGNGGASIEGSGEGGGQAARNLAVKALVVLGGAYLVRKLTKRTTRWDHSKTVAQSLCGEKFSADQAARDPMAYFNLRLDACPATTLSDGSKVLYYEQAFWRTPERPFRQRFYMVKPCPKEMKCDVEVASYAVKDVEQYRNFCDRAQSERPQPSEAPGSLRKPVCDLESVPCHATLSSPLEDMGEHLTTVYLNKCERGRKCLYEGSTPPGGFPNNWNGATRCTSEMTIFKNGELHCWDRAWDDNDNQVWGPKAGPYEFKPRSASASSGPFAGSGLSASTKKLEDKPAAP